MKRSRIAGSPSLADVMMRAGDGSSSSHLWEAKRYRAATDACCEPPPPPSIVIGVESLTSRFGFLKFLDECSWCRKWIPPMSDVFMYRGCAYCTDKCREWQYAKDAKEGGMSPVRSNTKSQTESLMKNAPPPTTTPLE